MAEKKLKMSNKRFRIILTPFLAILLIVAVVANIAMNMYSPLLDMYFGKGDAHVEKLAGTESWNGDYYGVGDLTDEAATTAKQDQQVRDSAEVSKQVVAEGVVLLKNNGALPVQQDETISPFGRASVQPFMFGTGSGNVQTSNTSVAQITFGEAFKNEFGERFNDALINDWLPKIDNSREPDPNALNAKYHRGAISIMGSTYSIGEFPWSEYPQAAIEHTDVGIVVLARMCGENGDLNKSMADDGLSAADKQRHQLELDDCERDLLEHVKQVCDKVVVVLNVSTSMELGVLEMDDEIDAILWMSNPGTVGFESVAKIISGEINPSGRTVDTFAADLTLDPTFVNFGLNQYSNVQVDRAGFVGNDTKLAPFTEYEEGIYVGYRYYETAAVELGEDWYNAWKQSPDKTGTGVVYPFGHGLSYTTFDQKIKNHSVTDGIITVEVEVANTGNVPGKEVVQVYYSAPYYKGGIEKAAVVLGAFAKTDILAPGALQTLTLQFAVEDMASFDFAGEGCYVLDQGDYTISLRKNAHEIWEGQTFVYTQDQRVVYDSNNPRQSEIDAQSALDDNGVSMNVPAKKQSNPDAEYVAAVNRFDDINEYMTEVGMTNLSRSDWANTFPTAAVNGKELSIARIQTLNNVKDTSELAAQGLKESDIRFNAQTDAELGNVDGSHVYHAEGPTQGANNGISLIDMRGLSYYDSAWDQLLDQLTYSDDEAKVTQIGNFLTQPIGSPINKPDTNDQDGPQGLSGTINTGRTLNTFGWQAAVLVASSWNTELAEEVGHAIGREGALNDVSGWYAPGLNIHRSPFGGRNFEYYSEDGLLAGKIAAGVVSGTGDYGVYCYIKHFAVNNQENERGALCTWLTEQALREIYLKPFEICIKEARSTIQYIPADSENGELVTKTIRSGTAVMSALNRIGTVHCAENYALLTSILRDEWGFTGMVITDMGGGNDNDRILRSGNDLRLTGDADLNLDTKTATGKWAIRNALHNMMYTIVNSNAMNQIIPGSRITYTMAPWQICLMAGNVAVGVVIIAGIASMVMRTQDEKKHPERYAKKGKV